MPNAAVSTQRLRSSRTPGNTKRSLVLRIRYDIPQIRRNREVAIAQQLTRQADGLFGDTLLVGRGLLARDDQADHRLIDQDAIGFVDDRSL
jgi:hypothetical protein